MRGVDGLVGTLCLVVGICSCGDSSSPRDAGRDADSVPDGGTMLDANRTDTGMVDAGPLPDDPDALRSLYYLNQRQCSDGSAECTVHDGPCGGSACTDLRPGATPYDMESPPPPTDATPVMQAYPMRWVPLCRDGSGDHEWTLDRTRGAAPTCPRSEYIRCADGTRPLYWADSASMGNWDDGIERWVIWAGDGGGWAAGPMSERMFGTTNFRQYLEARTQAFTSLGSTFERSALEGMFNPFPSSADRSMAEQWFARYTHRVFIRKCTPDNWLGERAADFPAPDPAFQEVRVASADESGSRTGDIEECYDDVDEDGDGGTGCCQPGSTGCVEDAQCGCRSVRVYPPPDGYRMFFHGRLIIDAVLADLERPGGIVTYGRYDLETDPETFPRLDNAAGEQVVFVSGSNGTNGHYQRLDSLAAQLSNADVRGVLGQYFPPRIEVEHAIDLELPDGTVTDAMASVYDHVVTGTSLTGLDLTLETLAEDGAIGTLYEEWGVSLDESCVAAAAEHPYADPDSICRDSVHVGLNHLSTPVWLYMGQRDVLLHASRILFHAPHCADASGPTPCDYVDLITLDQRRAAIRKQFADLAVPHGMREEGDYSRLMIFSPNVLSHGGLAGSQAFQYSVGGFTQGELLIGWMVDELVTGICMTDWAPGTAQTGNSNMELLGTDQECVLVRP